MKRSYRKQTRNDFMDRVQRLDPAYVNAPKASVERKPWELEKTGSKKSGNPVLMSGLGFGLALGAILGVQNPETVREVVLQSGWPPQFISYAMNGALVGVGLLVLFFVISALRIFSPQAPGRANSGGLVFGAIAAVAIFSMPAEYRNVGVDYVGAQSSVILDYAQARSETIAAVDWSSVVMVSSAVK